MSDSSRTSGEVLFEKYLNSQEIPFEFEKEHAGKQMVQLGQMSSEASFAGPKKPAATVGLNPKRREFGEL
jgi:hypothetical protein